LILLINKSVGRAGGKAGIDLTGAAQAAYTFGLAKAVSGDLFKSLFFYAWARVETVARR
jgi:hypothetical protein